MTKYVCKRDQVCAGLLLIKDFSDIVNTRSNRYEQNGGYDIRHINGKVVRGILFRKDNDGNAHDLIFDVDVDYKYPIKNFNEGNISSYYIDEYANLEELLKYLGYNKDLTQFDLIRIYKKFILHNRWLRHNREIFGLLKMSGGSYGEGGLEMVSIDIYNVLNLIEYSMENRNTLVTPLQKLIKRR